MSSNIGRKVKIVKGYTTPFSAKCDTSEYEGQEGIVVTDKGDEWKELTIKMSDGIYKDVKYPGFTEECIWVEEGASVYDQMMEYYDERITSLTQTHEKWLEVGTTMQAKEEQVACSSAAAGIFDTICEIKKCKEIFQKLYQK